MTKLCIVSVGDIEKSFEGRIAMNLVAEYLSDFIIDEDAEFNLSTIIHGLKNKKYKCGISENTVIDGLITIITPKILRQLISTFPKDKFRVSLGDQGTKSILFKVEILE